MERDFWYSSARSHSKLDSPAAVGRRAAERTVRRLGARKVPTAESAGDLRFRHRAIAASAIFSKRWKAIPFIAKRRSWRERLGERVASENVTVIDDGTLPGLFGTSPFDDEGVPSRRTVVIDRGVLQSYLLNSYTARKLGLRTTGNAARGVTGNAGVGHGNFFLQKGERSPEEIIRGIRQGLYVTELIGHGVNVVTGDYSRGAAGLWIENGEFAYPVSEITIAANLRADADGRGGRRLRPGISGFGGIADAADPGDDRQWAVRLASTPWRSLWLVAGGLMWFVNRPHSTARSGAAIGRTPRLTFDNLKLTRCDDEGHRELRRANGDRD